MSCRQAFVLPGWAGVKRSIGLQTILSAPPEKTMTQPQPQAQQPGQSTQPGQDVKKTAEQMQKQPGQQPQHDADKGKPQAGNAAQQSSTPTQGQPAKG